MPENPFGRQPIPPGGQFGGPLGGALQQAALALRGGKLAEAEALARKALAEQPTRAKLLLAIVFARTGRVNEAVDLFREVLLAEPEAPEALSGLATVLLAQGQFAESAALCQRALLRQPNDPITRYNLGRCLLAQRQFEGALANLDEALRLNPRFPQALHDKGWALQSLGRAMEAADCYRQVIALAPQAAPTYAALGRLLLGNGNAEGAIACFRKAHELSPNSPNGIVELARALIEEGNFAEAESALQRAIALDPNSAEAHALLGRMLQQQGRFQESDASLQKALDLDPGRAGAYYTLINGRKIGEADRPLVQKMVDLALGGALSLEERRPLEYALGKAYEDLGQYEAAIQHFEEANRISQIRLERAGRAFDPAKHRAEVDRAIQANPAGFWLNGNGSPAEKPIFIVGMARSGTTLLEQIVSSHPDVGAAGELGYWLAQAERPSPSPLAAAEGYLALLQKIAPGKRLVTDKMPRNFALLGPILRALPHARVIHCRRNPVDTCLSIFTTSFLAGPEFAHRREDLVIAYQEYLRLMTHWRAILPPTTLLEVDYEELVADPEGATRRIVAFLGLDWSDELLHHERNVHAISTPSLWQARQPVYRHSVERWRRYEPWLGALRELLTISIR